MNTPGEAQRWALFQQETAEAAARLGAALARRDLDEASRAVFTLNTAAALLRVEPLQRVGRVLRAALHGTPGSSAPTLAEPHRALLGQAAAALPGWLAQLRPDAAPPFSAPLGESLARLEELTGLVPSCPPAPRPEADAAARFVPLVDDDMIEPFLEESQERLEGLGQKLLRLEARGQDPELIADIFRDLHTLKGSSGFVGLRPMNQLAHAAEDLVGQLRCGGRAVDRAVIDALLAAVDGLRTILGQAAQRTPFDVDLPALLRRLQSPGAAPAPERASGPPASEAPEPRAEPAAAGRHTLRVDFDKLDLLLNLVGELVLGKSRLRTGAEGLLGLARELGSELRRLRWQGPSGREERVPGRALPTKLDQLQRLLEQGAASQLDGLGQLDYVAAELREQVMRLRMVPIGRILGKHHRTVRELGHSLGRRVRLEVEGADTELDKLLVEQLDDPLLHLVRNAVDHGIEPPDERVAAGKPAEGVLRLRAWHRGNQIVVEVSDDGRGIDLEAVRARAAERGLGRPEELAALDEAGVLALLFQPGFSTAQRVSDVSGRGVGLDVVQRAVQRLKGSVEVQAERGRGTRFLLRLPLTLAIIQVLLVQVRGEVYALPLELVCRAQLLDRGAVHRVYDRDVLLLDEDDHGGGEVPLIDVAQALGLEAALPAEDAQAVLVEVGGAVYALLCDRQLGKREIVVKSLGELLLQVPCVAGATLIDDRVVLLLDLAQLVQRAPRLAPAVVPPPAAPPPRAARILLAEDSAVEREALCRLLQQGGYEVVAAQDGRAALQIAESDPLGFDLVSTDATMPHLDGYELTRRLRAQERHRDVPILMLTARSEPLDRVRGFDAGVDDYLVKPVDAAQLLRAVARHLHHGGREARR